MSAYAARMKAALLADGLRYAARLLAEDAALGLADVPTVSYATYESRGYTGPWAASKPRLRCHGSAAFPPTPEAAQRLADGLVRPTVWWTPGHGQEPRVAELAQFTSRGRKVQRVREVADVAGVTEAERLGLSSIHVGADDS